MKAVCIKKDATPLTPPVRVICIENVSSNHTYFNYQNVLTKGNTYSVGKSGNGLTLGGNTYLHIEELNRWCPIEFFITLSEFRENRINKILE